VAVITTVFGGMMTCLAAFALNGTKRYEPAATYTGSGWFNNAISMPPWVAPRGRWPRPCCSLAAVLGAGAVSLSTSYAFADSFGQKHSLHRTVHEEPAFYIVYAGQIVVASLVVLLGRNPLLGTLTQWVQVLAGILLPSAILFLVLLRNEREVLGP
jgi:hypothetical protein